MRGYGWGLFSVVLVSAVQLLMKWAMMHLPPLAAPRLWLDPGNAAAIVLLAGGLLAYACSMGCWFMALRRLPLNKAYPLLSLSYVLVAAGALMIPEFHERFTLSRLMGVALICGGLLLICLPARKKGGGRALAILSLVLMLPSVQGGTIGHFEPRRGRSRLLAARRRAGPGAR